MAATYQRMGEDMPGLFVQEMSLGASDAVLLLINHQWVVAYQSIFYYLHQ